MSSILFFVIEKYFSAEGTSINSEKSYDIMSDNISLLYIPHLENHHCKEQKG